MYPEELSSEEPKSEIFWPDKHSVLATDVDGSLLEILQRAAQEAAAEMMSEALKERIRGVLDQVVGSTSESIPDIQVWSSDVAENSGFNWGVNIEIPAQLIPEDAFELVYTAIIYRFRSGGADKQLLEVPDHDRSIVKSRVQKWLRGRFLHAHKGHTRRRMHAPKAKTLSVIITTKERRLKSDWRFRL